MGRTHTQALSLCARRAYQEAKAIYMGGKQAIAGTVDLNPREGLREFRHRMVDSLKKQGEGPVEK